MENDSRSFNLGQVLNITSGRLFTNMDDIYDIMSYIVGRDLYTLELAENRKEVAEYILSSYPELSGVGMEAVIDSLEDAIKYLDNQKQIYGDKFVLTPMTKKNDNVIHM